MTTILSFGHAIYDLIIILIFYVIDSHYLCIRWDGLKTFLAMDRTPIHCGQERMTKGFIRSYKNFHFYWILGAGHFVSPFYFIVAT